MNEACFGPLGDVDYKSLFQASFGNLVEDRAIISDPCGVKLGTAFDQREAVRHVFNTNYKALTPTTGGAGTAGYAMVPVYVDSRVIDTTRKYNPLVEIIPRVANLGLTADYNKITAKGAGQFLPPDSALSEQTDTYDRGSKEIKYVYSVGRVLGQAIAAYPNYLLQGFTPSGGATGEFTPSPAPNAKQLEVLVKTRAIREAEEDCIINGDSSTDTNKFDGIIKQMGTTNTVDKNTSALALDDIIDSVQYAFDDGGRPNLAVCSSGVYSDLEKLLTAKIGYMQPTKEVFWGFETIVLNTKVGKIPVIPSMYMSNTSGSKAMYFLDLSVIEMRVLQDMTYQEMAVTNDSQKFFLKIYETLVIKAPTFCSSITEIA